MKPNHPIAGVGAVVIHNNHVLLVKRAKPPKQGLWCIPGGKVRLGETLQQAAEREIKEETGVIVKAGEPVYVFDLIEPGKFHYIIVDVLAEFISGVPLAGDDAGDAGWFSLDDLNNECIDNETKHLLQSLARRQRELL